MVDYLYDNSFQGLLTTVFKLYEDKKLDANVYRESNYKGNLINTLVQVYTDSHLARRVMKGILDKLGEQWLDMVYKVYLSEEIEADQLCVKALIEAFKTGKTILNDERHPVIQPFLKLGRKVAAESHNFLGYIRFSKLKSGVYYSCFEPTYNILPLLAPHFADRLKDQSWVIHDTKRSIAAFYDQDKWHINPLKPMEMTDYAEDELVLQNLWRGYFQALAIDERTNLKLQQQKIPKKYWPFFIEEIGLLKQNGVK